MNPESSNVSGSSTTVAERDPHELWEIFESAEDLPTLPEVALRLQKVVEAVAAVVKDATGKDAFEMVGQIFPRSCLRGGGTPQHGAINQEEVGKLERILPNLIMEAINGKKIQNPAPEEQ